MNPDIRQFKLINGEEIICEVVEEYYQEEMTEGYNLFVRAAMALSLKVYDTADFSEQPYRYYSLNPWMVYGEDIDNIISLRSDFVLAEVNPSPLLMDQYVIGCKEMKYAHDAKIKAREEMKKSLEKVKESLQKVEERNKKREVDLTKKAEDNVVKLFTKNKDDTLH